MYAKINIVKKLEPAAEKFMLENDRLLYLPFFTRAEEFCIEHDVLLGGSLGLGMLVGRGITKDSFMWDLYCDNTFATAKQLADTLCSVHSSHVPARTVALETNIRQAEFTIRINTRVLFKIYALDRYRGIKLIQLMGPAVRDGYLTKAPIKCISEEMQLIDIYRTLYTPAKNSSWAAALEAEDVLYGLIKGNIADKAAAEISGGADGFNKARAESTILKEVIAGAEFILIGDHAVAALGLETRPSRLQIVSSAPIADISTAVSRVLNRGMKRTMKVTYTPYALNIPSDFQLAKYTLYVDTGRDQTAVLDVFNAAAFEMIPWWDGHGDYARVKIGNPWVLMRFQFIDIWVLRLILNLGSDPRYIKGRINDIAARVDAVRQLARGLVVTEPEKLFQLSNYAGVYVSEAVAKKRRIAKLGDRFPIYYPIKHIAADDKIEVQSLNEL